MHGRKKKFFFVCVLLKKKQRMESAKVIGTLVTLSFFILLALILSSVAFSKAVNSSTFTTTQQNSLTEIAQNTTITSSQCLSAKCFTDSFSAPNARRNRASINSFTASQGVVTCASLLTPLIDLGTFATLDDTGLIYFSSDGTLSTQLSQSQIEFKSGSNSLILNQSGLSSTSLFQVQPLTAFTQTLQLGSYTTVARTNLTNVQEGTMVYDSDLGTMAVFQSNAWFFFLQFLVCKQLM